METRTASNFWWMKSANKPLNKEEHLINDTPLAIPKLDLDISSSLADFLEKEQNLRSSNREDVDVGSIIEEINRVAAQSPLGPFNSNNHERSIEDIMKEAEKVYLESSKSFEQLSQRSKTSQNISELVTLSNDSTPTPKSLSPLPLDPHHSDSDSASYSEDFSPALSQAESVASPGNEKLICENQSKNMNSQKLNENDHKEYKNLSKPLTNPNFKQEANISNKILTSNNNFKEITDSIMNDKEELVIIDEVLNNNQQNEDIFKFKEEIEIKDDIIKTLQEDNHQLKTEMQQIRIDLEETKQFLESTKSACSAKAVLSPEINLELDRALEDLKDSKEINTSLQLQIDTLNRTHKHLKTSYDDLLNSKNCLERRVADLDGTLDKYKSELINIKKAKEKLFETESTLTKMLDIEKLQNKSLKQQNDKDAKCIQDLNRQIKEMERIIARKHPDSVSALIVAAKKDESESNLTTRKLLEDRIKLLEQEATVRDNQSSKVFLEIQDKFNQMKLKYESHIEDLELHVSDLKSQLKRKLDTFDVYTQTKVEEQHIPQKESHNAYVQTDASVSKSPKNIPVKRNEKVQEVKAETHLIATIRGLQSDLSNKEKVINKLQKDIDELRKTNRRLQKEREGSLRNLSDRREFKSYPEKLANQSKSDMDNNFEDEIKHLRNERDKLQKQLRRCEEDYQVLKEKRIFDLTTLQDAHECEITKYISNINDLRQQTEVDKVSFSTLQGQLSAVKEELAIVVVERDHLNHRLLNLSPYTGSKFSSSETDVEGLHKKIAYLETRYEEREHRLRAIVHGLAQKNVTNRSCEQCSDRQMQLISYKNELDQLLATLKALQ